MKARNAEKCNAVMFRAQMGTESTKAKVAVPRKLFNKASYKAVIIGLLDDAVWYQEMVYTWR